MGRLGEGLKLRDAGMAELVDALDLGSSTSDGVGVRVPLPAWLNDRSGGPIVPLNCTDGQTAVESVWPEEMFRWKAGNLGANQ